MKNSLFCPKPIRGFRGKGFQCISPAMVKSQLVDVMYFAIDSADACCRLDIALFSSRDSI
jgi:hypothetical protein